jgi:hypothetical protein
MPDEAANAEHFGYSGISRGEPAFPQLRLSRWPSVARTRCGQDMIDACAIAPAQNFDFARDSICYDSLPLFLILRTFGYGPTCLSA